MTVREHHGGAPCRARNVQGLAGTGVSRALPGSA